MTDDEIMHTYEGFWSHFSCVGCGEVFEIEGDVSSGEVVCCNACGLEAPVEGR